MIRRRSASLSPPQAAISPRVRPQPMQSPLCPLTAQTLMHGVAIGWFISLPQLSNWIRGGKPTSWERIVFR